MRWYRLPELRCLLDCAADLGENMACVRPNQAHGAYNNDEKDCEHHGILGDVLSIFV